MFKIQGSNGTLWFYNNLNNSIYDCNKAPINPLTLDSALPYIHPYDNSYLKKAYINKRFNSQDKYMVESNVTNVVIRLGSNCNSACLYCMQKSLNANDKHIPLEQLKHKIRVSKVNWSTIKCIEFWGGEPLVYWKYIKQLVPFFISLGFKGYFHLTTNALLLNKQITDFLMSYPFDLMISHDGVNHQLMRGEDPLNDERLHYIKAFKDKRPNNIRINMVYSPIGELDIFKSFDLFLDKLGDIDVIYHWGMRCDQTSKHLMAKYTPQAVKTASDYLFRALLFENWDKYKQLYKSSSYQIRKAVYNLVHGRLFTSFYARSISINNNKLHFDINGNILLCHSSIVNKQSFGSIDDLDNAYITNVNSFHHRKQCAECCYASCCGGPCLLHDALNQYIDCKSGLWKVRTMFDACWFTIFNERPIRIEKCDP